MKLRILTQGFSTLELLIAFSLSIIFIAGTLLVTLPSQSIELDATLHARGLMYIREHHTEILYSLFKNWGGMSTTTHKEFYGLSSYTTSESPCTARLHTNSVWESDRSQSAHVALSSIKSNMSYVTKSETGSCDPTPPTEWNAAKKQEILQPLGLTGTGTDIALFSYQGTDYVVITTESNDANESDIWIINITAMPPLLTSDFNIGHGAKGISLKMPYAYVLHASNTEQVKIFDVRDALTLNPPSILTTLTLPFMTSSCVSCLTPKSIAFFDGYLYIGMPYIANLGSTPIARNNELHIFCVSNPLVTNCSPETPQWLGSFNVNHNIEDIVAQETYIHDLPEKIAYLATSASAAQYPELTILNVTNPQHILPISSVHPSGNSYGTSVSLLGNTLYLGRERTTGANTDFLIIDIADPWNPTISKSQKLNLKSNTRVSDITSAGSLAFVATTDTTRPLHIFDTKEEALITKEPCAEEDIPTLVQSIYHHNTLYAASKYPAELITIYDTNSCQ